MASFESGSFSVPGGGYTRHLSSEGHALDVEHEPFDLEPTATRSVVRLRQPYPDNPRHSIRSVFDYRSGQTRAAIHHHIGPRQLESDDVPAPSDRVQQLIAQHHLHPDQWPILLDALQEEYPQLHEAIESHHAARRAAAESDATQYARAVSATLSATR